MPQLSWSKLLSTERLFSSPDKEEKKRESWEIENSRTEIERDYDRILFSAPTRRLADKTQVFPLERNVSIRTRLTHSYEVSNLARSIGTYISHTILNDKADDQVTRNIPAMLAAVGLVHDLGNPPFGHKGELAISSWFQKNEDKAFEQTEIGAQKNDFLSFEGNAQTLRLLTKLQVVDKPGGLNLTTGTLAALMKYTVGSNDISNKTAASEKYGFFQSEKEIANKIFQATGLAEGMRHPLACIMEACDDIAYSVLDAEDAVKKELVSFSDLNAWLYKEQDSDAILKWVISSAHSDYLKHRQLDLSPSELNDVSMQKFRVYAIHAMVCNVVNAFNKNYESIMNGEFNSTLIKVSGAAKLCSELKKFDKIHAYRHISVLKLELEGNNVLHGLMDMLWQGITERENAEDLSSDRKTPFAAYAYRRISENYRREFEKRNDLPRRYKERQLLTDMISGMADSFAMDLYDDLRRFEPKSGCHE